MRRPSNRVFQVFQREREREKERDFHPQMAACFQVILTWSSLTTAKLFPLFSLPPPPPLFFVRSGFAQRAGERKQKRWPEVMARLDQRAGKFSNLASTCYGKLQGGGVKGSRDFIRRGGGCVFSRLCDVSGGRNQKFRDTPDVEGLTSLL